MSLVRFMRKQFAGSGTDRIKAMKLDVMTTTRELMDMKQDKSKPITDRRGFLKLLGAGVAGGGAALGTGAAAAASDDDVAGRKGSGYRETKHVRTYYDLAKF